MRMVYINYIHFVPLAHLRQCPLLILWVLSSSLELTRIDRGGLVWYRCNGKAIGAVGVLYTSEFVWYVLIYLIAALE